MRCFVISIDKFRSASVWSLFGLRGAAMPRAVLIGELIFCNIRYGWQLVPTGNYKVVLQVKLVDYYVLKWIRIRLGLSSCFICVPFI